MSNRHYWSSDKLTPENIALVKKHYSNHVPMKKIHDWTGLSLYYIRQIIDGIEIPTDGKHRPTGCASASYRASQNNNVQKVQQNTPQERVIISPNQPKVSPPRLIVVATYHEYTT